MSDENENDENLLSNSPNDTNSSSSSSLNDHENMLKDRYKALTFDYNTNDEQSEEATTSMRRTLSADTIYNVENNQSNHTLSSMYSYYGRLMIDRYTQTPPEWYEIDLQRSIERKMPRLNNNNNNQSVKMSGGNVKRKIKAKAVQNSSSTLSDYYNNDSKIRNRNSCASTSSPSKLSVPATNSPQHQYQNQMKEEFSIMKCTQKFNPTMIVGNSVNFNGKNKNDCVNNYKDGQLLASDLDLMINRSLGRNSVEELNQEIEKLVLEGVAINCLSTDPPEGHRAPIDELFSLQYRRTVNTQTPSSTVDNGDDSEINLNGRSTVDSLSPCFVEHTQSESPVSPVNIVSERPKRRSSINQEYGVSPEINKFLSREPPDGCEKIKVVNEDDIKRSNLSHVVLSPFLQKPSNTGFVLLPSQRSAFLPLNRNSHTASLLSTDLSANINTNGNNNLKNNDNNNNNNNNGNNGYNNNQFFEKRINDFNSKSLAK